MFPGGATRDTNEGKLDFRGCNSSIVELRFAQYMKKHCKQEDGSLRGSDNWKAGIPVSSYFESLARHYHDLWLIMEGYGSQSRESDIFEVLCAIRFNVNGLLYEHLRAVEALKPDSADD